VKPLDDDRSDDVDRNGGICLDIIPAMREAKRDKG